MLVSIAIIAILITMVVLVVSGITNLSKKVSAKENALSKVENTLNAFTASPDTFSSIRIYYDQKFIDEEADVSSNYLDITYSHIDGTNLYSLSIMVYVQDKAVDYGSGTNPFTREVQKWKSSNQKKERH